MTDVFEFLIINPFLRFTFKLDNDLINALVDISNRAVIVVQFFARRAYIKFADVKFNEHITLLEIRAYCIDLIDVP